jgi:hypothetical protein
MLKRFFKNPVQVFIFFRFQQVAAMFDCAENSRCAYAMAGIYLYQP